MKETIKRLESHFGPIKGWWPSGRFPDRRWEICAGALLTQNTNWKNAEKVLDMMKEKNLVTYDDVLKVHTRKLEDAVKPSGFYRQKAKRLRELARFIDSFGGMDSFSKNVSREQLISIKGIGDETADSILLYALGRDEFVVDAYTRRIFSRLGMIREGASYAEIKGFFSSSLPRSSYREFHAWIVELAKAHCRKAPLCEKCPLRSLCTSAKQY